MQLQGTIYTLCERRATDESVLPQNNESHSSLMEVSWTPNQKVYFPAMAKVTVMGS